MPIINGRTLREQLEEIEQKMKILRKNDLENTTSFYMLVNSKMLIKDLLANQLIKEQVVDSVKEVSK